MFDEVVTLINQVSNALNYLLFNVLNKQSYLIKSNRMIGEDALE